MSIRFCLTSWRSPKRPHESGFAVADHPGSVEFPKAHWKHLRTMNPVELPFAAVRLRTAAAKRYEKVENATAVIWKTLLIAERTFRRLDAPELLADVANGVVYVNGVRPRAEEQRVAA